MKVIEFMGMPKAGKTTAIEVAESYLKKNNKKVRVIFEGARISPLDKEPRFLYNSWSFHNTMNRILEARLNDYDFLLIDRGIYDHVAFSEANDIFCDKNKTQIAREYYKLFGELEDKIFLYMLSPEEVIYRERKNNPFLGRVFNKEFLGRLYDSYSDLYLEILSERDIILFDGRKNLEENSNELILNFDNLFKEKVLDFEQNEK